MGKHKTVRLTEEAHTSLIEEAISKDTNMKTIASEAILFSSKRENELCRQIEALKEGIQYRNNMLLFYAIITGVAGAILGLVLGIALGTVV